MNRLFLVMLLIFVSFQQAQARDIERPGWHAPRSSPRDLPHKGLTDPASPPSWAGAPSLRSIWGIVSGYAVSRDGIYGVPVRVPTGGHLLFTGHTSFPRSGKVVVLQGAWTPHRRYRWGVMWNPRCRRWYTQGIDGMPSAKLSPQQREEQGGWRKVLESGKDFESFHSRIVQGPMGSEPYVEMLAEVWRYEGNASSALARLSRNRMRQMLRRDELRSRSGSMGLGPRKPLLRLHRVGHVSGWKTALVGSDTTMPGAWFWAVGGPWIVVFQGSSLVELDLMGRAILAQKGWSPKGP